MPLVEDDPQEAIDDAPVEEPALAPILRDISARRMYRSKGAILVGEEERYGGTERHTGE